MSSIEGPVGLIFPLRQNSLHALMAESYCDLVPPLREWPMITTVAADKLYCPIVCPKYVLLKGPASCRGDVPALHVLVTEEGPGVEVSTLDDPQGVAASVETRLEYSTVVLS